ncbi:hypothetical protein GCM10010168_77250 [Actinoplanes ianthinogenes]|uniref:Uncharacterized protein n=1 Tax=Actinoplanes ianthinogenes TaxID=122358 RepID=A0ABM7M9L9_9ACTN|nr:hypothetical protein [Actinoplanes ianthinogenes]BCJ48349.1 hypothetical protein Aiant_90060 [Actinoplanes ianthinogenes]GGR46976.1 hypothetical protein GCM10010168_77250 [Actinoplanes ianthinogenes]
MSGPNSSGIKRGTNPESTTTSTKNAPKKQRTDSGKPLMQRSITSYLVKKQPDSTEPITRVEPARRGSITSYFPVQQQKPATPENLPTLIKGGKPGTAEGGAERTRLLVKYQIPDFELHLSERSATFVDATGQPVVTLLTELRNRLEQTSPLLRQKIDQVLATVQKEQAANQQNPANEPSCTRTAQALRDLMTQTQVADLAGLLDLSTVKPMPEQNVEMKIEVPAHLRSNPVLRQRFRSEVERQWRNQQEAVNDLTLQNWLIRTDLFKHSQAGNVDWSDLGERPDYYVNRVNEFLINRLEAEGTASGSKDLGYKEALQNLKNARGKPGQIRKLLAGSVTSSLNQYYGGRSNTQTAWARAHAEDFDRLLEEHSGPGGMWEGLAVTTKNLQPLHNPDQVFGGNRDMPADPADMLTCVGLGIANEAIGAALGLAPKAGGLSTAVALRERMTQQFGPELWPLQKMNFRFNLKFADTDAYRRDAGSTRNRF